MCACHACFRALTLLDAPVTTVCVPCALPQTLLDDPDIPGFQPALPDDFDVDKLADEMERNKGKKSKR